ncbi:DNA-directed RNA polymerase subunit omega [Actinomyces sp. zg-332]|uniref:DNA-directed RNA polymerase subunit omega n=1 Tax=Actinomyces sp. zg-332 TaxID=2708340 RepID=UPI0014214DFB|nr:DNA-directed RNA polymerase subunit omega [Actinomyces sp. zg-332]QPK94615.1 DNA-directed RNA polymerase subunit omega [Actinomyces sp. zg-332]
MSGVLPKPEGVIYPPIDDLLRNVESKYALVVYAAKRARQINTYNQQLQDGMLEMTGPLVQTDPDCKPLSIALREINEDKLELIYQEGNAAE